MAIIPTTELDAINVMLSGIGESPVNTLIGEMTTDVSMARSILQEVSRQVQLEGWTWNTEHDFPLAVNQYDEVNLPPNILRIFFRVPDNRVLTVRGRRMYDVTNHTYKFTGQVRVDGCSVTLMLEFEELPEAAKRYITLRALRIFQERTVGASALSTYQRDDEARSRGLLLAEERKVGRHNMLQGYTAPNGAGWNVFTTMQRVI